MKRRIAFVHNFSTHYTAPLFECLADRWAVDFYFSSEGDAWFWPKEQGTAVGSFEYRIPPALRLGQFRFSPSLLTGLWRGRYDAFVKSFDSRVETLMTYLVARLKRRPFILWTGVWSRIQTPFHRLGFPFLRHLYRSADAVVVYGTHVGRYLTQEGVDSERVFVAPHSIDNSMYSRTITSASKQRLREALAIPNGSKVILFVGRLEEQKGLRYLLDAIATLRGSDLILVLVGSGSQQRQLQEQAVSLGIAPQVRFVGHVHPSETINYYAIAWVTVLPSIATPTGAEAWGLVVNESFNQAVPVIATDTVGAAVGGLVQDGRTGLIVPERSSTSIAHALQKMIHDEAGRHRMSACARNEVSTWTLRAMADAFDRAVEYACLTDSRKRRGSRRNR